MDSINRIIENGKEVEPVYKKKRGIILLRQTDDLILFQVMDQKIRLQGFHCFKEE